MKAYKIENATCINENAILRFGTSRSSELSYDINVVYTMGTLNMEGFTFRPYNVILVIQKTNVLVRIYNVAAFSLAFRTEIS